MLTVRPLRSDRLETSVTQGRFIVFLEVNGVMQSPSIPRLDIVKRPVARLGYCAIAVYIRVTDLLSVAHHYFCYGLRLRREILSAA